MAGPVQRAVHGKRDAAGLVVIITNDYSSTPHLRELKGTKHDGHSLQGVFTALGFTVCWERNVTGGSMHRIIKELRDLKFAEVKGYQCIVFVFAGHGCEGDYLCMQDGSKLQINGDIVDPLLPRNAQQIGSIKKAFLIDACRGTQETLTTLVPRSCSIPCARGGTLMDTLRVSTDGNFLLAYSTLPMHIAYESGVDGGAWLSTMVKLLSEKQSSLLSLDLEYILTEVNKVMSEKQGSSVQQPDRVVRLNGHINLDLKGNYSGG